MIASINDFQMSTSCAARIEAFTEISLTMYVIFTPADDAPTTPFTVGRPALALSLMPDAIIISTIFSFHNTKLLYNIFKMSRHGLC